MVGQARGEAVVRSIGAGSVAGGLAGLVWGGIGGRLAMALLVLTSDDRVRGVTSDDGFEIGRLSGGTIFLLIFTAVLGAIGGFAIGALHRFLRGGHAIVVGAFALTGAVVGGGLFVSAEGIDFHLLEPTWLAIGLFVFLPGAWAATAAHLVTRFLEAGEPRLSMSPITIERSSRSSAVAWLVMAGAFFLGVAELMGDIADLT